jgi:hypothetical protein
VVVDRVGCNFVNVESISVNFCCTWIRNVSNCTLCLSTVCRKWANAFACCSSRVCPNALKLISFQFNCNGAHWRWIISCNCKRLRGEKRHS